MSEIENETFIGFADDVTNLHEIECVMIEVLDSISDESMRRFAEMYATGNGDIRYSRMRDLMAAVGVSNLGVAEAREYCRSGPASVLFALEQKRRQLKCGFDLAWKRERLAGIANNDAAPSAAVSAIKEMNNMDHSYDRKINHPELANAPLLDRQQTIANLVSEGQLSLENAKILSTLTDSQINSGQLKLVNELVKRIEAGEEPGLVATDLLGRLPEEGQQSLPSFL